MPLTTLISSRFGTRINWKHNNFLNKNSNFYLFLELKILKYIKSIFNIFNLNPKTLNKFYSFYSLLYLKKSEFRSPILMGNSEVKFKNDTITIYLNFYYDTLNSHPDKVNYFLLLLTKTLNTLSKILVKHIVLIKFNYNSFFFRHLSNLGYITSKDLLRLIRISSPDQKALISFYQKIRMRHISLVKYLYFYKQNQYFYRILNVIFSAFLTKKIDLFLIVNSIAYELETLRKQHKKFIYFVTNLLSYLFSFFTSTFALQGLQLTIKGRITPFNREHPRSIKKVINFGTDYLSSDQQLKIIQASSKAFTRYGAVNITLNAAFLHLKSPVYPVFTFFSAIFYFSTKNRYFSLSILKLFLFWLRMFFFYTYLHLIPLFTFIHVLTVLKFNIILFYLINLGFFFNKLKLFSLRAFQFIFYFFIFFIKSLLKLTHIYNFFNLFYFNFIFNDLLYFYQNYSYIKLNNFKNIYSYHNICFLLTTPSKKIKWNYTASSSFITTFIYILNINFFFISLKNTLAFFKKKTLLKTYFNFICLFNLFIKATKLFFYINITLFEFLSYLNLLLITSLTSSDSLNKNFFSDKNTAEKLKFFTSLFFNIFISIFSISFFTPEVETIKKHILLQSFIFTNDTVQKKFFFKKKRDMTVYAYLAGYVPSSKKKYNYKKKV